MPTRKRMQYFLPQNLRNTTQKILRQRHALEEMQRQEKPGAPELWENWKWWVELRPEFRPFWPPWRLTLFEDIGIDESRFQQWYATRKNTFVEHDFFDIVFEFFFDQTYGIPRSPSVKTILYRSGMHKNVIRVCMAKNKKEKSITFLLFSDAHDRTVSSLLPLSLVYKQMLEYA